MSLFICLFTCAYRIGYRISCWDIFRFYRYVMIYPPLDDASSMGHRMSWDTMCDIMKKWAQLVAARHPGWLMLLIAVDDSFGWFFLAKIGNVWFVHELGMVGIPWNTHWPASTKPFEHVGSQPLVSCIDQSFIIVPANHGRWYTTHIFRQNDMTHVTMVSLTSEGYLLCCWDCSFCFRWCHMFTEALLVFHLQFSDLRRLLSIMPWTSFGSFCRRCPTFFSTRQSSSQLGSASGAC